MPRKGLTAGFDLLLWKRASIASEPSIDHGGLPLLLTDTTTRKGCRVRLLLRSLLELILEFLVGSNGLLEFTPDAPMMIS
jgi:hypothetical protein